MLEEASCDITIPELVVNSVGFTERVNYFEGPNVLESVVHALKFAIDNILPTIADVHGFWAEFFYPSPEKQLGTQESSFYGSFSDDFGYPLKPNKRRKVAATGIMVDRFLSGDGLDGYFGPPPMIFMLGDERLPENTHIRLYLGKTKYLDFQLERQDAIYGMDDVLVTKLILIPIAAPQ